MTIAKVSVKIRAVVTKELVGTFEGDTLDECLAAAELEAASHGEIIESVSAVITENEEAEVE